MSKIETIEEATKRLMLIALNKYGSVKKAHPYLSPSGHPSIRSLYRIQKEFKIVKDGIGKWSIKS